jgi:hypothetical protein
MMSAHTPHWTLYWPKHHREYSHETPAKLHVVIYWKFLNETFYVHVDRDVTITKLQPVPVECWNTGLALYVPTHPKLCRWFVFSCCRKKFVLSSIWNTGLALYVLMHPQLCRWFVFSSRRKKFVLSSIWLNTRSFCVLSDNENGVHKYKMLTI